MTLEDLRRRAEGLQDCLERVQDFIARLEDLLIDAKRAKAIWADDLETAMCRALEEADELDRLAEEANKALRERMAMTGVKEFERE